MSRKKTDKYPELSPEHSKHLDLARKAVAEVYPELMQAAKDGDRVCSYSQGIHSANWRMFENLLAMTFELIKRVADLERRPQVEFKGVWREGQAYPRGAMVSHQGSTWCAMNDHPGRPGEPSSNWQLAVKRGRDGKV